MFRKLFGKSEEKTQDEVRLEESLQKTRNTFFGRVSTIFQANEITEELWDELEEALVMADVGMGASEELVTATRTRVRDDGINTATTDAELLRSLSAVVPFIELPDLAFAQGELMDGGNLTAINVAANVTISVLSRMVW